MEGKTEPVSFDSLFTNLHGTLKAYKVRARISVQIVPKFGCDTQKPSHGEGDSIKVAVRVRPQGDTDLAFCLQADGIQNRIIMHSKPEKIYTFDYVADMDETQENVFTSVGRTIIDACMTGYNGTIFAYGQTGSGKTFTMLGPSEDSANFQQDLRGVIPRSFEYIFSLIERQKELHGENIQFLTKCSFLEIYNEQIFDLLDEASNGLQLRENIKKGVFVDGLIEQTVSNAVEAYQVLTLGWVNRTVAETSMNRESSRSHAVFTLSLQSKTLNNGVWNVRCSNLNLVDLAGSERQKDTHTTGVRLKEAGSINKSLSVLGNVIMSLVDLGHGKNRHVPYRDSRLTFLLRDSLGGNAKTCIVACVHPGAKSFGESLSTIHFARRAKMIKNKAVINEDAVGNVIKLQAEIRRLKESLAQYEAGNRPAEPSLPIVTSPTVPGAEMDTSVMRQQFLQAMYFVHQAVHQQEVEKKKSMRKEETLQKMEKMIRSKKMIVKFRDESLKKYDKAFKEKRDLNPDEKDVIITNQGAEIALLQDELELRPIIPRQLEEENIELRREIQRLRTNPGVHQLDQRRATELDQIYAQLQAENEQGKQNNLDSSPKNVKGESTISQERQKQQIEELTEQLKQMKQDMQAYKEKGEKEMVEIKAELDSMTTRKDQVEKILKSQQVSVQVERETMSQIHLETIKSLTPQRSKKPRDTSASGTPTFSIAKELGVHNSAESKHSDSALDILDESMPKDMYSAIEDELRSTKEELNTLKTRLEEKDGEIVNHCTDVAKLKSEKTQLNEILQKERQDWVVIEEGFAEKFTKLQTELHAQQDHNRLLEESVRDFNIVMNGQERSIKELKSEKKSLSDEQQQRLSDLSTKALKMETELNGLKQTLEETQQECARLKESEDTARETLSFTQSQVEDLESQLETKNKELARCQAQLEALETKLKCEEERNYELSQRLAEKSGEEAQLLDLTNKLRETETRCEQVKKEKDEIAEACKSLEAQIADKVHEIEKQLKKENELTEANQSLKNKLYNANTEHENACAELRDSRDREAQFLEQVRHLEVVKGALAQDMENLQLQLQKKDAHLDNLQEDLDGWSEQYNSLQEENNGLTLKSRELEAEIMNLKLELQNATSEQTTEMASRKNLEDKVVMQNEDIDKYRENITKLQVQLKITNSNYAKCTQMLETEQEVHKQQNEEFKSKLATLQSQYEETQHELSAVKIQLQTAQDSIKEKEAKLDTLAPLMQELVELKSKNKEVEMSENEVAKLNEEVSRLQGVLEARQIEFETMKSENVHLSEQHNKTKEENRRLLNENSVLTGHANQKQKIHYMEDQKKQLIHCQDQLESTKRALQAATLEKTRYKRLLEQSNIPTTPSKKIKLMSTSMSVGSPSACNVATTEKRAPLIAKENCDSVQNIDVDTVIPKEEIVKEKMLNGSDDVGHVNGEGLKTGENAEQTNTIEGIDCS